MADILKLAKVSIHGRYEKLYCATSLASWLCIIDARLTHYSLLITHSWFTHFSSVTHNSQPLTSIWQAFWSRTIIQSLNLIFMARYSKKSQDKVERAMHEMKHGELKSGRSGKKVTNPRQAVAIGLSEAREEGAKVPPPSESSTGGRKGSSRGGRKSSGRRS